MKTKFSVVLEQTREVLFDYLADPKNRPDWQSSIVALELIDQGPPHVGQRWRERARPFGEFAMKISELSRPLQWAERGRSPRGNIDLQLTFCEATAPTHTEVTVRLDLHLAGVFKLSEPFVPAALRPLMTRDLKRAARLAGSL